ncbi:hypothetical protein FB451DRAFT_1556824 [Mycena latifolia]|nr:hypothetical protein FB451DRAFT_1556824 [Mycena latifolia]
MSNVLDLNGNLGATEIGSVLGSFLFGIETLQTYNYYRDFPRDSRILKTTVALVWFLELGHTMSAWHALYSQTVTFYGQPQYISSPPHSEEMTILFAAMLYTIVQTFFANRVRVLSGRWEIMAVACALSALRFVANMGSLALLLHYSRVSILLEWRWLVSTALGLGLTVDILITASMCHFLRKMRSCDSERTRTIVETLIVWTIESTLLTSEHHPDHPGKPPFAHSFNMLTYRVVWTVFFIIQAKLFSNSMLASLNGRLHFRNSDNASSGHDALHFKSSGPYTEGIMISLGTRDLERTSSSFSRDVEVKCTRCTSCGVSA